MSAPELHDYRHREEPARDLVVLPRGRDRRAVDLRGTGVGVRDGDLVMYTETLVYRVAGVAYSGHKWTATGTFVEGAVSRG